MSMSEKINEFVSEVGKESGYDLSGQFRADTGASPDSPRSAGAQFLMDIRDAVIEGIKDETFTPGGEHDYNGAVHQIADNAPDVHTYPKWQQFIDLAAWEEDLEISLDAGLTMDEMASLALCNIAQRLAGAILAEFDQLEGGDDE